MAHRLLCTLRAGDAWTRQDGVQAQLAQAGLSPLRHNVRVAEELNSDFNNVRMQLTSSEASWNSSSV